MNAAPAPRRDPVAEGATATNPSGLLSFWARERPSLVALREAGLTLTYGAIEAAVVDLALRLTAGGVRPGDRVVVLGGNEAGAVAAIFAAWRVGAWAVPLNARYTQRELSTILAHAEPAAVVATSEGWARHANTLGSTEQLSVDLRLRVRFEGGSRAEPVDEDPAERVVLMLYTSGTTGAPKGVMLPARALRFMAGLWAHRPVVAGDRIYQALPISHSYGLCSYLYGALNFGCEVELASRFDPERLRSALAEGVALFQGVPAMYARYLEHLEASGLAHAAPKLKAISTGGAPLDPDLKRRVDAVFGIDLRQAFGLTEAGPTVTIPDSAPQGATALGRPAPGAEVRIVEPETGRDGHGPGELLVRTPGVMKGYFRDPAGTAAVLDGKGWLRTGDLARRAADGVLHIVGRAKDVIIRSGFNVYPAEVEAVLLSHPAVVQAAVVGRAQAAGEEAVVAFVELVAGASVSPDELLRHAGEQLAGYKRPSELRILDKMPMGLSGKIATSEIRAIALGKRSEPSTAASSPVGA